MKLALPCHQNQTKRIPKRKKKRRKEGKKKRKERKKHREEGGTRDQYPLLT